MRATASPRRILEKFRQRGERSALHPHRAIRGEMVAVEIERGAVFCKRAGRCAAEAACDVDIKQVATAGSELAEEGRQIGLRLRIGYRVELCTIKRTQI